MSKALSKRLFLALAASYLVISINFGVRYTYGLLALEMMNELFLSNQDIGIMISCYMIAYVLMGLVTGPLIDRKGAKMTILTMFPLVGVGSLLIGLTSSVFSGALFSVIAGMGASAGWAPVIIWSQKLLPEKRGLMVGIMESGTKLCPLFIALAVPYIVPVIGWRGVWLLLGVTALFSLLLVAVAYEPRADDHGVRKTYLEGIGTILGSRYTWLGGLSYALSAFAIMVHVSFYKAYLNRELMVSSDVATQLYGLMYFVGFIGALSIPTLSDRIGRRPLIIACNAMLVASLLGFLFSKSIGGLVLFTVLIGIDLGAKWPLYATIVKDLYDWKIIGLATTLWALFSGLGSILAPYVSGLLADIYSSYKMSYIIGIVAGAIAMALMVLMKTKKLRA